MRFYKYLILTILFSVCLACGKGGTAERTGCGPSLREELYAIADSAPGTVGIAFVSGSDTVTVNNGVRYAMMSVFKLHQALAVIHALETRGCSPDSVLRISASELDTATWSPMLKDFPEFRNGGFDISVGRLIRYAVTCSDNNASNLLFSRVASPAETDAYIRSIAPDTAFRILYSEHEMKARHGLSYLNHTSPLSAALLIGRVMRDSLVSTASQDSLRLYLSEVTTGHDRLGAVASEPGIAAFAHKTGSGYRNGAGELMAHNDVGYFRLADGRDYCLAVFIRDFRGTEAQASRVIAAVSECVYRHLQSGRE